MGQRAYLIDKMAVAHKRGGDVSGWLPLLAQTQAAIDAIEAAMRADLLNSLIGATGNGFIVT